MIVYLDIILLVNIAIDTLLLWFTAYFRKERVVWWRILVASVCGSCYLLLFFFPSFSSLYQWPVKLLLSILILWIAFGNKRLWPFTQNLIIFYFVAFVFGGGVFALHYFFAPQNEILNGLVVTHNDGFGVGFKPTFAILAIGFALVYVLGRKSYQAIQEPRRLESFLADVIISLSGERIICKGLVDTGNQLHEPITRTPVMILEARLLAHLLPPALVQYASESGKDWGKMDGYWEELPPEWQSRVRLIPYRSVSRGMDFLLAIKPDYVRVWQDGLTYETEKVLVGLNPIPLAADGKYQAIVHPEMVNTYSEKPTRILEQEGS
ncbi:sigma-E processing peptidase SpoIIGA [Brevibacillus sp. TJ4]|uniref:sigma-E processing peptidase SpoIIGA n=1 Tax=Brevibacillus sp. TJ4 TaxID=3234853 RepID=UPI0037D5B4A5